MVDRSGIWKSIGPGLIWAAAAIGVSHLVQSTRAGALFGFGLVWAVIAANLLKYPFFEFGPRYAAATGESLLEGYQRLGKWALIVYTVISLGTTFTILAAVTLVTASLATQLFSPVITPLLYTVLVLLFCVIVLSVGRYPALDTLVKLIIVLLTISSVAAVVIAVAKPHAGPIQTESLNPKILSISGISFLVALIGWIPSAIDISVWHSLWTLERAKQTQHKPSVREALLDFNIGYIGTAAIALLFLSLGALVMYGSGEVFSSSGAKFASQLIGLYTRTLGDWSRPVILVAAFTTMFSTTLTCTDAFPRVLSRLTPLLLPEKFEKTSGQNLYWIWMLIVILGALLLLTVLKGGLTFMVDLATTLSFLTAPILGYLNLRVVTNAHMPEGARPGKLLRGLSWAGIVFGSGLGIVYLLWRFIA